MIREESNLLTARHLAAALLSGMLSLSSSTPRSGPVRDYSADSRVSPLADQGTFVLSVAGQPIGTERFEIRPSQDKVEAEAEIHLRLVQDGKKVELRTFPKLVLDSRLNPSTYTWTQKGSAPSQLEVDFRSSPAKTRYKTVKGEDDQRDFSLPKDVVVLDDNVLHHYQLVVARYNMTTGGKQSFHAFIPQEALPGVVNVEDVGEETLTMEGSTTNLRHLVITTELARIDLWVDGQQHLERIAIPEAQFEAVRKK